jgi:prepilin-type processing-associated H-X9-DG protein
MFLLLPFIEQDNIYRGGGEPTIGLQMIQARKAKIKIYFCPSRRPPTAHRQTDSWYLPYSGPDVGVFGQSDYAGCIANNSTNNGTIVRTFDGDKDVPGPRRREPIRLTDLADGLTQTLMVGDKKKFKGANEGFRSDDNEGYSAGWDHDTLRRTDVAPLADDGNDGDGRFGGRHPSGFNALLGDGSVRFIKFSIQCCGSGTTFYRLGHRTDGGVLGNDF